MYMAPVIISVGLLFSWVNGRRRKDQTMGKIKHIFYSNLRNGFLFAELLLHSSVTETHTHKGEMLREFKCRKQWQEYAIF